MERINQAVIESAMTYKEYRQLTGKLLTDNKTTGNNHSEAMLHYTRMNAMRMERLDKKTILSGGTTEKLASLEQPLIWLAITEAWCGDAAQILPVLAKMADENENIELKLILRDEHLDIMDAFLTNGARSIPKVIILNAETLEVLGDWGPRPAELQAKLLPEIEAMKQMTDKAARKARYAELSIQTQKWYNKDKTVSIQEEFLAAVLQALKKPVTSSM